MDHEYNFKCWWNANIPQTYPVLASKFCWLAWNSHTRNSGSFLAWLRTIKAELPDSVVTLMLAAWNASTLATELQLPDRAMTAKEQHDMEKDIVAVVRKYLSCDGRHGGSGPCCDTCLRLCNACYTDAPCINHG